MASIDPLTQSLLQLAEENWKKSYLKVKGGNGSAFQPPPGALEQPEPNFMAMLQEWKANQPPPGSQPPHPSGSQPPIPSSSVPPSEDQRGQPSQPSTGERKRSAVEAVRDMREVLGTDFKLPRTVAATMSWNILQEYGIQVPGLTYEQYVESIGKRRRALNGNKIDDPEEVPPAAAESSTPPQATPPTQGTSSTPPTPATTSTPTIDSKGVLNKLRQG